MSLTVMDWFCGAGGSSQGIDAVPGVDVALAANHWQLALDSHASNFPGVRHERGDIRELPVQDWPVAEGFWASPECTKWTAARGKKLTYAQDAATLPGMEFDAAPEADERSRALMWDVPRYLEGVQRRGKLVLFGVVENVVEARKGAEWDAWVRDFHKLGYRTRLIAFNSMHAQGTASAAAPQSRDRLYMAYWHTSLGRSPDFDKWLRPRAWCAGCAAEVDAMQVWKKPGVDMGRYRAQYVYRCPSATCRNSIVEPYALPAASAIDWTLAGQRIGDRDKPLADKTRARIAAGLEKFARPITLEAAGNTFERRPGVRTWPVDAPMTTQTTTATKALAAMPFMVPAGGTWRVQPTPVTDPMPARTTRENDGIAVPPLLVPVEGRDGKVASPVYDPMRTQTARNETGLAWTPFVAELRGGGSVARSVSDSLATVTASGNHHGLVTPPDGAFVMRNNSTRPGEDPARMSTPVTEPLRTLTTAGHQSLLVPYYSNGTARPVTDPMGALSTRDRYALATGDINVDDVLFRMLEPSEIGAAMAFGEQYIVLGSKRDRVRQYGNAVTPPVAELIVSALAECVHGEALDRSYGLAA